MNLRAPSSPSPQLQPSKQGGGALRTARPSPRGPSRTYGVPALGEHGSSRGGSPSQPIIEARLPALPRLHTRCAKGTSAATPAGRLPSSAAGSSGTRCDSVPPPQGHPPAAGSFVAVVPRRAEGVRERRTGRAWDGHQRSFADASTGGRRPQRPGAAGLDPTGRGGRQQPPLGGSE